MGGMGGQEVGGSEWKGNLEDTRRGGLSVGEGGPGCGRGGCLGGGCGRLCREEGGAWAARDPSGDPLDSSGRSESVRWSGAPGRTEFHRCARRGVQDP